MDKRWFVLLGLLVVVGYFALASFKTANVVLNYEQDFKQGDKLSGVLTVGIEDEDRLDAGTPILVSLTKGDSVISSQTMTLDEFIVLSGAKINKVERNGKYYFETPGSYNVPISKVIDYSFKDKGEYQLLFSILDLNMVKVTAITVR